MTLVAAGALGAYAIERRRRCQARLTMSVREAPSHAQILLDDRFSAVFNAAPVAIMLVRIRDGQLTDVNAAFTELWNYTRAESLGRTSTELNLWIAPAQLIQQLRDNRHSDVQELQIRTKEGEPRDVLASVTMFYVGGSAHLLVTAVDITERNRGRQLEHIAHHDALTQLPNRRMLWARLRHIQSSAPASAAFTSVLYIDLDGFKHVNDTLGHAAGDELLRLVAARLRSRLRAHDLLARLGGDEFVAVLEDLQESSAAQAIADDLVRQIGMPFVLCAGCEASIGASIGISYLTAECSDVEELLAQADTALYGAKHAGRNTVRTFLPSQPRLLESLSN
jgi:diguanylate cyclase (GGDEF)-like protein/PAS domain S-box-containing protein